MNHRLMVIPADATETVKSPHGPPLPCHDHTCPLKGSSVSS